MSINTLKSCVRSGRKSLPFPETAVWMLLVTVCLQYTSVISDPWATVFIVIMYVLVYVAYWFQYGIEVSIPRSVGIAFGGITALFLLQVALGKYARGTLALFPVYTSAIAFANLFLIPQLVDRRTAFKQIALFGTLLGVVFFITVITGYDAVFAVLSDDSLGVIHRFVSNIVGVVGVIGAISSLDEVMRHRSMLWIGPLIGNVVFAGIITSPGVVLILVVGLTVYILDSTVGHRTIALLVESGFVLSTVVVSVVLLVPTSFIERIPQSVDTLPGLTAHMRYIAWRGAFAAILDSHLLWGAGFRTSEFFSQYTLDGRAVGAHNSFLRVFFQAGIVAFILYLVLIGGRIRRALQCRTVDRLLFALTVALGVNLFFESYSFWSTGIHGVLLGLVFGYLIVDLTESDAPSRNDPPRE